MSEKDAKDYADSIHAVFVETSAKNAININEVFIEISEYIENFMPLASTPTGLHLGCDKLDFIAFKYV